MLKFLRNDVQHYLSVELLLHSSRRFPNSLHFLSFSFDSQFFHIILLSLSSLKMNLKPKIFHPSNSSFILRSFPFVCLFMLCMGLSLNLMCSELELSREFYLMYAMLKNIVYHYYYTICTYKRIITRTRNHMSIHYALMLDKVKSNAGLDVFRGGCHI